MKKQILLVFALIASLAYSASAYTIIIQGGGSNHQYNYIFLNNSRCECRGRGNNGCPVNFGVGASQRKLNMEDVVNYVLAKYEKGEKTGATIYAEVLPVEWRTTEKDELIITTKEDEVFLK